MLRWKYWIYLSFPNRWWWNWCDLHLAAYPLTSVFRSSAPCPCRWRLVTLHELEDRLETSLPLLQHRYRCSFPQLPWRACLSRHSFPQLPKSPCCCCCCWFQAFFELFLDSDENMKIMHRDLCFFIRLDLSTSRYQYPELKSFLLNICAEAPESITNCRSSGFVEEGAGIFQASAGEWNVSCDSFFEFVDFLSQVSACSADASLLPEGFILRSFHEFWSPRTSVLRFAFLNDSLRWTFCSRITVLENLTARCDTNLPTPPRRLDFFQGHLGTHNPTWILSFNQATDALRHFSLTFCWAGISLSVSEMTTVTMLASGFRLVI